MTKDELTQAFVQLSRGFNVAADLVDHFMPAEPAVSEAPAVPPAPAPETVSVPFPSAEHVEALKTETAVEPAPAPVVAAPVVPAEPAPVAALEVAKAE